MDGVLVPVIVIPLGLGAQFFFASRHDWQCEKCDISSASRPLRRHFCPIASATASGVGSWRSAPTAVPAHGLRQSRSSRPACSSPSSCRSSADWRGSPAISAMMMRTTGSPRRFVRPRHRSRYRVDRRWCRSSLRTLRTVRSKLPIKSSSNVGDAGGMVLLPTHPPAPERETSLRRAC